MPIVSCSQFVSESFDVLIVGGGTAGLVVAERLMSLGAVAALRKTNDAWEKLGNVGWNWKSLLTYFKKAESVSGGLEELVDRTGAPLAAISRYGTSGSLKKAFQSASNLAPGNSGSHIGVSIALHTVESEASRQDSSSKRANLIVLQEARVMRVIFDDTTEQGALRVSGVEFMNLTTKTRHTVHASREVVLCAGAFGTPQVLELSGIGRRDILQRVGVESKIELPVGDNLQDHVLVASDWDMIPETDIRDDIAVGSAARNNAADGLTRMAPSAYAFVPLQTSIAVDDVKSIASTLGAGEKAGVGSAKQYDILSQWLMDSKHPDIEFAHVVDHAPGPSRAPHLTMLACLLHPSSRGSVHITSSDPMVHAEVDLGTLSTSADQRILANALKLANKAAATVPLTQLLVHPMQHEMSDDVRIQFVKEHARPMNEAIGTVPMLPREDGGVVDSQLNVYGTSNLRVVDASVIPLHISHHLHDTVCAVAEMAADVIKARYAYVLRGVYNAGIN